MSEDIQEGDLVVVTAIGRVESISESGVVVRLHGELVPFLKNKGQVKRIPEPLSPRNIRKWQKEAREPEDT